MQQLILILIPLAFLAFWAWMAWDFSNNARIPNDLKLYWIMAFIFLNVFTAIYYYLTEYDRR